MVLFKVFEEGMEVNGTTIMSVIDGMGAFKRYGEDVMAQADLRDIVPDESHWYSQQKWLDAFEIIARKVGPSTLYQIGSKIPENAVFPPEIDTIEKALGSIDVAYHMNHRNANGEVLFDPNRDPPMLEGIGHYKFELIKEDMAIITCENPYPDDFDRGIITAMAKRFSLKADVRHDDSKPCRNYDGKSCTYAISW
ncbi:MAG: hypothetical protein ACXAD7_05305 [Candidatus Kariarchaeaceae archaeon]|jgi:hypothetical protein